MVGRYELSPEQWERICDLLPGKAGDRAARLRIIGVLSMECYGYCAPVRIGTTFLHVMASGKRCINASRAGQNQGSGNRFLHIS